MTEPTLHVAGAPVRAPAGEVRGEYVTLGEERFYRIANYDRMRPFFLSVVSASNHWLFISSNGGLTAGRQSAANALFPYYTEDKIRDGADHTGSRTVVRVERQGRRYLWEPFDRHNGALYGVSRNLYKNVCGNKLIFEEVNEELGLLFRYGWTTSDRFGFVKRAELRNTGGGPLAVEVLDGIQNVLPWGLEDAFQNQYSCLGDAYKQSDLEGESGIATYSMSSLPGDSAEPAEALRATVCWTTAPREATRLVSSLQLDEFRRGGELGAEDRVCGRRGAFFVHRAEELAAGERREWSIVADVDQGPAEVAALRRELADPPGARGRLEADVEDGTRRLTAIVARADGLQETGDREGSTHHFSNVLFNVMRGGVFESAYQISVPDLAEFVRAFNRETWARRRGFFEGLGERVGRARLLSEANELGDADLLRLVVEYLPLSFSRRHGDPSRPWNRFSINVKRRDGSRVLDYQGNWRDIFQNWEALALSFPEYLGGMIAKFVNTTTADGYNPYRVTRHGFDWEVPEPDEPWANFGYWGDHQIVYLLKFLELSRAHHPGELEGLLGERRFVYADVPYDIKPYEALLEDPRDSIAYSTEREARIAARVAAIGLDGKCLASDSGGVCRVNLTEKLLVPLLAKMANFVPGGGFWMNTQRPEWNDANNALAGYGVSMVTLFHARRYVSFFLELLGGAGDGEVELSEEIAGWLAGTREALAANRELLDKAEIDDAERKAVLDGVGRVAGEYRSGLYAGGLSGRGKTVPVAELRGFLELTRRLFDQTIGLNRRDDGLYHAYNVLEVSPEGFGVRRLQPMLEGQVAVLSSGVLSPRQALAVLAALRRSAMYRADQHSYLLYPDRQLPAFLEKNRVPAARAESSKLLARLIADGNTDLVEMDVEGGLHFNGLLRNARDLRAALARLAGSGYAELVEAESELVSEIFEEVFDHRSFTGRSGTFYGYEGLGCIYWHMVSKLLLAVQENCRAAADGDGEAFAELAEWYYDVRCGLGFNKTPEVYGAFPTDPYSHTPGHSGARQPGMTGQVKEEILTRLGEFGLKVEEGRVGFRPDLLRRSELLAEPGELAYLDVAGEPRTVALERGELAFTYCQVPVVYRLAEEPALTLHLDDGGSRRLDGLTLDAAASRELFRRTGRIVRLEVALAPGLLDS